MSYTSAVIAGGIAAMSLWGLGAGIGSAIKPEPEGMRLISLQYADGKVSQEMEVFGTDQIVADWAAKMMRGRELLCAGGGSGVYTGDGVTSMDLDIWVGDDCPKPENGDKLIAAWEYVGPDGVVYRLGGEMQIKGE